MHCGFLRQIIWSTILLPFKILITTEFIALKLLKGWVTVEQRYKIITSFNDLYNIYYYINLVKHHTILHKNYGN
nr:MAG TPA: hypothetical protein [Caudoviricetes sp.]